MKNLSRCRQLNPDTQIEGKRKMFLMRNLFCKVFHRLSWPRENEKGFYQVCLDDGRHLPWRDPLPLPSPYRKDTLDQLLLTRLNEEVSDRILEILEQKQRTEWGKTPPWEKPFWRPARGKTGVLLYLVLIHVLAIIGLILFPPA